MRFCINYAAIASSSVFQHCFTSSHPGLVSSCKVPAPKRRQDRHHGRWFAGSSFAGATDDHATSMLWSYWLPLDGEKWRWQQQRVGLQSRKMVMPKVGSNLRHLQHRRASRIWFLGLQLACYNCCSVLFPYWKSTPWNSGIFLFTMCLFCLSVWQIDSCLFKNFPQEIDL